MTTVPADIVRPSPVYAPRVQQLVDWLNERPGPWQLVALFVCGLAFQLAWSALGVALVAMVGSAPSSAPAAMRTLLTAPFAHVMPQLALGVLVEELLFRLLPLGLALAIYRDNRRISVVAAFVLLSAVVFALFHGQEWYRLALQAVGGIVLSIVYLKASGMRGRYWGTALATTFALHLAINATILLVLRAALVGSVATG